MRPLLLLSLLACAGCDTAVTGPGRINPDQYVRTVIALPLGVHHDFNPPGFAAAAVVSVAGTGVGGEGRDLLFTGLAAPTGDASRLILFRNEDNTSDVVLLHDDARSQERHRFRLPSATSITLPPDTSVWLLYDLKWERWTKGG